MIKHIVVLCHGKHQTTSKEQLAFFSYRIARIIRNCVRFNLLNMNAIEVISARIKALKDEARMWEDSEQSFLQSKHIRGLYNLAKELENVLILIPAEKHFLDMTKEEQEDRNELDLKEMALYYGGFDKLKEVIAVLEDNQNEAAWYRSQNDY